MNISSKLTANNFLLLLTTTVSLVLVVLVFGASNAEAATITPDGTTCTVDEAVGAINAGSDQSGCVATGAAYGTDDTINIPAGTFSYNDTADISQSITISGAGMGQTIIDLNNSNAGFEITSGTARSSTIEDLTIIDPVTSEHAIYTEGNSMTIRRIEIYSTDASSAGGGILIHKRITGLTSLVQDIYIHDIEFDSTSAIDIATLDGSVSSGNIIERVTIEDVDLSNGLFALVMSATTGGVNTISGTVRNSTITNVDIGGTNGAYIGAISSATDSSSVRTSTVSALNNTIVVNRAVTLATAAGIAPVAITVAPGVANSAINAQNNVIVSIFSATSELLACTEAEIPAGGGTPTATFTSLGGNLTDDTTNCDSFFTETNDQTSVSNLASTIGPLQDNGGATQTMALLTGSPALDNGITNAISADQRGTSRPQGSAFDTGAFELAVSSPSGDTDSSSSSTLANTGDSKAISTLAAALLIVFGSAIVVTNKKYTN